MKSRTVLWIDVVLMSIRILIQISALMPIWIGINRMPIHMRILPQLDINVGKREKNILLVYSQECQYIPYWFILVNVVD
jgi:hypothetical protein